MVAGVVTILSPCILPILPILLGRSLQAHRYGPVALVVGLALSFAGTGCLLGVSAQFIGSFSSALRYIAIGVLLLLGLSSAFPEWSYGILSKVIPPRWRRPLDVQPQSGSSSSSIQLGTEFLVGTQLGILWIPCAGPILGSILALIAADQNFRTGFVALLAYGLGAGIPMLVISYGSRGILHQLQQSHPHMEALQRVAGVLIALAAVAMILRWDVQLQLWLAPLFPPVPL